MPGPSFPTTSPFSPHCDPPIISSLSHFFSCSFFSSDIFYLYFTFLQVTPTPSFFQIYPTFTFPHLHNLFLFFILIYFHLPFLFFFFLPSLFLILPLANFLVFKPLTFHLTTANPSKFFSYFSAFFYLQPTLLP
ncbi:hypothetical protein HMI56_003537 [Coelomomyces lativittatus]|nr:hypothetical protein HMI56_003537 [Coelomomyces lativittatus]